MGRANETTPIRRQKWKSAAWLLGAVIAIGVYLAPSSIVYLQRYGLEVHAPTDNTESFPSQPITIIAPASPGGGWDQLARLMQHVLTVQEISPVPVEVVNRGGAGGTIGLAELITQHRGDPYTLMVGGSTLVSALVMHDSRFNLSEVELLARLASEYNVVAVAYDSPLRSFDDLLHRFRADPQNFVWGGGSAGSADHLLIGLIAREAGVDAASLNYVAYTGGGEAAAAVMGQQVMAGVAGYAEWKDLAEAGKMRILAISSPSRFPGVDVPTMKEFGLDIVLENWRFVVAGPGIAPAEREELLQMITKMRGSSDWRKILDTYFWEDRFLTGPELEEFIGKETSTTAELLVSLGMGALGEGYSTTGPYLFPFIILTLLASLGAALIFQRLRSANTSAENVALGTVVEHEALSWSRFLLSALLILGFLLLLARVGFFYATPLYLVVQARLMGSSQILRDIVIAVAFTCAVYIVFEKILMISVP